MTGQARNKTKGSKAEQGGTDSKKERGGRPLSRKLPSEASEKKGPKKPERVTAAR